jgi:hypothetical protein
MTDSTPENESSSSDQPDEGAITDEQLPDDLRPDKNPMARDPEDSEDEKSPGPGGPGGPPAGADMGQPG